MCFHKKRGESRKREKKGKEIERQRRNCKKSFHCNKSNDGVVNRKDCAKWQGIKIIVQNQNSNRKQMMEFMGRVEKVITLQFEFY